MSQLVESKKSDFEKAIEHLRSELAVIRTGRANAAIVEGLKIEVYEQQMELKGIASIAVPDAKTIEITPWDKGNLAPIEKAIQESAIGINPINDGNLIRLVVPEMTEDTRKQIMKTVKGKIEAARIAVRQIREKVRDEIVDREKAKEISEDQKYNMQEELDKLVKEMNDKIDEIGKSKEGEIMTV